MSMKAHLLNIVGSIPILGNWLRRVARRYPEGSVVTIGTGLLKGLKWKRYHRYLSAYWLGHYEMPMQSAIASELSEGQVFWDIGANAGLFSVYAARIVGPGGQVVAFDPLEENQRTIREQLELNGYLSRASVRPEAVCAEVGEATFNVGVEGDLMGKLGSPREHQSASITVPTTTVNKVLEQERRPNLLKVDVEGAEANLLRGATKLFDDPAPVWIIEIHGDEVGIEVRQLMQDRYHFFHLDNSSVAATEPLPHHVLARPATPATGRF